MTQNSPEQHEVPRDPALQEAFDNFIHQTQVSEDFYAGVMERVQHHRARHRRWGEWESLATWWTQAWSPRGVWVATVCGLLALVLNVGLGYSAWHRMHAITRLEHALAAVQAQVRAVQAENQAWQTRQAALTDQLAALQAQTQREAQDNAALRDQVVAAQEQVRQTQAENQAWQARYAELYATLAALQQQEQRTAPQEPLAEQGTNLGRPSYRLTAPVAAQDRIRAKVGIEVRSGERSTPAKATETIKAGDFLRVYVVPEDEAYVYVVHNDGTTPTLLNPQEAHTKVPKGSLVTLPAPEKFYRINGTSAKESITVICSPTELHEVATLFRTTSVPQHNWTALEKELLEKSKMDLTQKADKPFQIVGNVRSIHSDTFMDTLQMYSGQPFVVKKYDFQVQK